MSDKIRKIILVIAVLVFVLSIAQLAGIFLAYYQGSKEYSDLSSLVMVETQGSKPETQSSELETGTPSDEQPETEEPSAEPSSVGAMTGVDFDKLLELNPDTKGWIHIEGTMVSYPIVQTDNNDYYLNHTFNKTSNSAGAIFMECLIKDGLDAKNPIIYGHNMLNGSMFGTLKRYMKKSFYEAHPKIQLFTPGQTYTYEIFTSFTVRGAVSDAYTYGFADDDRFMEYISKVKKYGDYNTGVEINPGDHIITLSTCTNRGADRYVIQARRIEEN